MPAKTAETDLDMARRHVEEAGARIARLERIVLDLQRIGRDASLAAAMVSAFVDLRGAMEDHLAILQGRSGETPAPAALHPQAQAAGAGQRTLQPVDEVTRSS